MVLSQELNPRPVNCESVAPPIAQSCHYTVADVISDMVQDVQVRWRPRQTTTSAMLELLTTLALEVARFLLCCYENIKCVNCKVK